MSDSDSKPEGELLLDLQPEDDQSANAQTRPGPGRKRKPPRTDLPAWMLESDVHKQLVALPRVRLIQRQSGKGGIYWYYAWDGRPAHGERILGKYPGDALRKYSEYEAQLSTFVAKRTVAKRERVATQYQSLARETVDILRLVIQATEPKPKPGVYFLLSASGEVLYVGVSDNVLARMSGHTEKVFETVRMIHVPQAKQRIRLEKRLIHLLTPPLNIRSSDSTKDLLQAKGFDGLPRLPESELFTPVKDGWLSREDFRAN